VDRSPGGGPRALLSVGLGLRWESVRWSAVPQVLPVLVLQLAAMPILVWGVAGSIGMTGPLLSAVVLEAAMPSMVLGVVLADRYGLDTGLYAMAVTLC
jgi:predicted permease